MQLGAINSINFESAKNRYRKKKKEGYNTPQQSQSNTEYQIPDAYRPINIESNNQHRKHRNGMHKLVTAAAIAGAMSGTAGLNQSCTIQDDETKIDVNVGVDVDGKVILYPVKPPAPDTVEVIKYDTIRDTIRETILDTIIIKDTVFVKENYKPEVADSLIRDADSLDIDTIGKGKLPYMITAYDPWNLASHKLTLDMDASNNKEMTFVDQIKDYFEDKNNPKTLYRRVKFSVDRGRGVTAKIEKASYDDGLKPQGEWGWEPAGKLILTNLPGRVRIAKYGPNNKLIETGEFKRGDKAASIFWNAMIFDADGNNTGEIKTQRLEQMKMYVCDSSKEANYGKPFVERPAKEDEDY